MRNALRTSRSENFSAWYQELIRGADLAENSSVRGCMVIRPLGYGLWERMQQELDQRFKDTGHENCYFPLFIPLSFFAKEAEHVEGFAKEMAVVTHHRLAMVKGKLVPDPTAELAEPLIVRPTSEMIIGDSFRKWIKTHNDLPVLVNQWANVVRWEMRTRLFLRTAEFLWQEGHTAHANMEEAMRETRQMLEVYRDFAENVMAMPVVQGEKTENERFPGASNSFSIEAMMQDGKALQAGTSHYLGTHFARAQNILYRGADQAEHYAHTTSWGVSTRLIGGLVMTHGDDDGLRMPPALAPHQVVILPRLRGDGSDGQVLEYCDEVKTAVGALTAFRKPIRITIDKKNKAAADKRWDWVRRGAPIILEVGARELDHRTVSIIRRDQLRGGTSVNIASRPLVEFCGILPALLADIQDALYKCAKDRMDANIVEGPRTLEDLKQVFLASGDDVDEDDDEPVGRDADAMPAGRQGSSRWTPWVKVAWSRPTGTGLDEITLALKGMKASIRVAPLDQPEVHGRCLFTGAPAQEEILIAKAY